MPNTTNREAAIGAPQKGASSVAGRRATQTAPGKARSRSLRRRAYEQIDASARPSGLSLANKILATVIILAVLVAVFETEPTVIARFGTVLGLVELPLGFVFLSEYLLRVWVAPEGRDPKMAAWRARLRLVGSPAGLLDLLVVVISFAPVGNSSAFVLRLVRLGRMLRLAKLGRMSRALQHMIAAVSSRRDELLLSLAAGVTLLLFAATALYLVEGAVQPDQFGSIPRSLWWAVATMTTIGYGDVYPVTALGKVLASLVAIVSIGLVAMPTGILAAAFSDAMQRHNKTKATSGG